MGIDANNVFQLVNSVKKHSLGGRIATLGVQTIFPTRNEIGRILEQAGLFLLDYGDLYKCLGFNCVESLDISDFEGCTHIFDLNSDTVPDQLKGRFDVIYNGGTLEHIFDLRAALRNIFDMLKPDGAVIHISPTNGWIDHGFYQISPTFFTDYYSENGFDILESQLMQHEPGGHVIVYSYIPGCLDMLPAGALDGRCRYFGVFRKNQQSTSEIVPQQRFYSLQYGNPGVVTPVSNLQYVPPYCLCDGRVVHEERIRIMLDKPQRGVGHEWMIKLSDLGGIADNSSCIRSPVQLWEGERPLGPPHSLHKDIRELGGGRFSHWNDWLHFSTSDNCEPGGREYSITIPAN